MSSGYMSLSSGKHLFEDHQHTDDSKAMRFGEITKGGIVSRKELRTKPWTPPELHPLKETRKRF